MFLLISAAYKHLKFYNRILTLNGLIWGVWGGFVLGLFLTWYHHSYLGEVVRQLLKKEALSPDSALTLEELGIKKRRVLTAALKEENTLRRVIDIANPEECLSPLPDKGGSGFTKKIFPQKKRYSYDFDKMKLYIPEEKKFRAESRYEQKKTRSPLWLIVWVIALTALAAAATVVIPDLLQLLDNFLSMNFD